MIASLHQRPLTLSQVQVLVRAMNRVAHSDGAHERELVLLKEFYEACRAEVSGLTEFAELTRLPFDAQVAKEVLDTPELQLLLLRSCYFLAYADGKLSAEEKQAIAAIVSEVGIDPKLASEARELTKDALLQQISRIENVAALKRVAAELDA
jgi:tellurite resistance protein